MLQVGKQWRKLWSCLWHSNSFAHGGLSSSTGRTLALVLVRDYHGVSLKIAKKFSTSGASRLVTIVYLKKHSNPLSPILLLSVLGLC